MADTNISGLTASAAPIGADLVALVDVPNTSQKKATLKQVLTGVLAGITTGGTAAANTTAIHAARDSAGVNGTVLFPPGAYSVNALSANVAGQTWLLRAGTQLTLAATQNTDLIGISAVDVTIQGESWTSVLDQNKANNTGGSCVFITGADRATLRNFKALNADSRGINVTNSDDVMIDRLFVSLPGSDGIFIEGNSGSNNCTVQNCKITGGPATGDADCISAHGNAASGTVHGFRALNNYLEPNGTGQFGIEVGAFSGIDPERVVISGNVIFSTANNFGGISMDSCNGCVVANNIFDANGFTVNIGGIEIVRTDDSTITANRITGDTTLAFGISVNKSNRNTFSANVISGWSSGANQAGLCIVNSDVDGETVDDNVVTGNVFMLPASGTNPGVLLFANRTSCSVQRNIITGNKFWGQNVASSVAIKLDESTGTLASTLIGGNFIHNVPTGITISTNCSDTQLGHNMYTSCATPIGGSGYVSLGVGQSMVKALASDHAISSTTGTEVTGLGPIKLDAGTYQYQFALIVQSATTTVGPMVGVNFTGTAAVKTIVARWPDATTVITAEVHAMDNVGILGAGFISGMAHNAYSTTAPNLGTTVGVSTINVDIPMVVEGVIVVTAVGDLELWHSSETATSTTVKAGSTLVVTRCA